MMHMIAPKIATWTILIVLYLLPAELFGIKLFIIASLSYHSPAGYNTFGAEHRTATLPVLLFLLVPQ